ncbi:hypothetical protein AB6D40_022830 [Vibrio cyclitrophicus]|jgi:hypothetical protein
MSTLNQFIEHITALAHVDDDPVQSADNIVSLIASSEEYQFPLFREEVTASQQSKCSVYWLVSTTPADYTLALYSNHDGCLIQKSYSASN